MIIWTLSLPGHAWQRPRFRFYSGESGSPTGAHNGDDVAAEPGSRCPCSDKHVALDTVLLTPLRLDSVLSRRRPAPFVPDLWIAVFSVAQYRLNCVLTLGLCYSQHGGQPAALPSLAAGDAQLLRRPSPSRWGVSSQAQKNLGGGSMHAMPAAEVQGSECNSTMSSELMEPV